MIEDLKSSLEGFKYISFAPVSKKRFKERYPNKKFSYHEEKLDNYNLVPLNYKIEGATEDLILLRPVKRRKVLVD
jgi:hypothetical protein